MTRYYLIEDRLLGKNEDGRFFLFIDGIWKHDDDLYIVGKLNGYDSYEPDDSPYGWGSTSVMDEIKEISEEEALEVLGKLKINKI